MSRGSLFLIVIGTYLLVIIVVLWGILSEFPLW